MMLTQQFTPVIQSHLDAADRHFDAGDELKGSWELWEASHCALQVVAEPRGWPCETLDDCNDVLNRLAAESDNPPLIQASLGAPELFHFNAEYDFLEDHEIPAYRKHIPVVIRRILDFAD